MAERDIRRKVASGLIWTYAERLSAQLITILVTIVLARLIEPAQYGLISIVNVFINIANAFVINGFGNSLIQKKDAEELDFSTVFYFSLAFSVVLYAVIFLCAGQIAAFYAMPELKLVTRIMAIRLPIAAINSIQQAYISKKMEFKKFFFATLGGTIISAVVGISLAYCGAGIWALVAQYLTNVCIDTTVLWFTSGWRPTLAYSSERMKSHFSYGWKIMCVGVMTTLYSNLRNLIIGKKYTSSDLAYSEKGEQFPSAIAGNINSSITKVLFPVLSDNQKDTLQLKRMVRRSIKVGSFLLFPIMFGLASIAEAFVRVLLTDKWIGCVPFLQIMCVVYALQPMQTAPLQCLKALGKSKLYLKVDLIKKIIGIVVLAVAVVFFNNVIIIVLSALMVEILSVLIMVPINKRMIDYSYTEQLCDMAPITFLVVVMCAVLYMLRRLLQVSNLAQMILQILAGAIVYIGMAAITKNDSFCYVLQIAGSILNKKRQARDNK